MAFEAEIPLIVGLAGVAFAVLERGYKTYLEQKKLDPSIRFSPTYMLNLLISTGAGTVIVSVIVPALMSAISASVSEPITIYTGIGAIIVNFGLGYGLTYRILDGLNTSTDRKMEQAETQPTPPAVTPPT
jgi:hypothetical protein